MWGAFRQGAASEMKILELTKVVGWEHWIEPYLVILVVTIVVDYPVSQ